MLLNATKNATQKISSTANSVILYTTILFYTILSKLYYTIPCNGFTDYIILIIHTVCGKQIVLLCILIIVVYPVYCFLTITIGREGCLYHSPATGMSVSTSYHRDARISPLAQGCLYQS